MKKKLFFIIFSVFSLYCITNAQRFQVTTGAALAEEYWAVLEDPALPSGAGYVTVGNVTTSGGIGQLWISSYNMTGSLLSSARTTTNRKMIARDISLAPTDATTGLRSYYVTGWSLSSTTTGGTPLNQAFICRVRLNGSIMWYREDPVTSTGFEKEGVALVTASNGDVAIVGNVKVPASPDVPAGSRIFLSRFSATGGFLWSNIYNTAGNWKVREMALGRPTTSSCTSTPSMPDEFVITGEVEFPTAAGGPGRPTTFAALYSGAGLECWRNLFPVGTSKPTTGDAGYDIIFNPASGNYNIVGVAQLGTGRAVPTSTPYLVEVTLFGGFAGAALYLSPTGGPMGLYPRCVALAHSTPGTVSAQIVFAGPDFIGKKTFLGTVPSIGGAGFFTNYDGLASANSFTQPFVLDDAQPEGILATKLNTYPGYLISTNAYTVGAFGRGDGHLIRTNLSGQTPDSCKNNPIQNMPMFVQNFQQSGSFQIQQPQWEPAQPSNFTYAVQQKFCKDVCVVTSGFTFTSVGSTYSFTNTSTGNGSLSYAWDFGDATSSTSTNPTHTYTASGTYVVCLTTTNINSNGDTCRASTCQTIQVVNPCNIKAGFTYTVSCKYKVSFTNTSSGTGPLTYSWLFDDGTTSTLTNPVKTFTSCGPHRTRLIACNPTCCDTIYITVDIPCCEVKSDFCLQDSGLYVKLIYNTAMNLPTTTYSVYVGGTLTTWTNNTYKLFSAGLYSVCLRARRVSCPGDTCCATCCKSILVRAYCSLQADFWSQVQTTGNVVFTNKTTPAGFTSMWDFGDGSPTSTTASPSHVYAPGTYTVCLTTRLITGMDTCYSKNCKQIIVDTPCKIQARFKTKHCLANPLNVDFINYSFGATSYMWDFGDGNTSTSSDPSHLYASPGTYTVCLYAISGLRCISKVCYKVNVSVVTCNNSCTALPPIGDRNANQEIYNEMTLDGALNVENGVSKDNTSALKNAKVADPVKQEEKLSLFPNPATQKMQVVFETVKRTSAEVTVVNALGNVVYKKAVQVIEGKNQFSIPVQNFANGNYFLKVNAGTGVHSTLFSVKN